LKILEQQEGYHQIKCDINKKLSDNIACFEGKRISKEQVHDKQTMKMTRILTVGMSL
jgi:hypothetical protein